MKNIKFILFFIALPFLFTACQEVVEVPLNNTNPKLVVDGLITSQPGPYYITLSQTGDFYSTDPAPKVTDAVVTVSDDAGNSEVLTHLSDKPGTYQTSTIQGVVGQTYYLNIQHNGQSYQAESKLLPVTNIDKLEIRFVEESPTKDEGYYIYFFAKEPQGETNYYRFYVYEGDSLYNSVNDLIISSDDFLKGDIENLELGYPFDLNDVVRLEMHSLSRKEYEYYNGLLNVLNSDGGLFSPPPVNPPSTISNGALGIFRASAVATETVTIK
ncbi:DUF4249 domain-containing protein [Rhodocytophaga rosea]|uniref:DUF4249 domain-containing protein n=1 Tax=Rhodocytophaga rosea TaxID=2704465 RepID=A0A6C0GIF2_9BACT|nr:DUF4249 domain-containing protein [Rhodocytophaga rosea]QHT67778.1 DUF4249 domain-containing protein [Rhodocytophaga rosea]